MSYTARYKNLIESVIKCLEDNKCKKAQALMRTCTYQGVNLLGISITNMDSENLKSKVESLMQNNFSDSLIKVKETKTTLRFVVPYLKDEK